MDDKQLLYQMLERHIDNIALSLNPTFSFLAAPAKNWLFNYIDPYVDMFFCGTNKLNADAAASFTKQQMNNTINDFLKTYNDERDGGSPES